MGGRGQAIRCSALQTQTRRTALDRHRTRLTRTRPTRASGRMMARAMMDATVERCTARLEPTRTTVQAVAVRPTQEAADAHGRTMASATTALKAVSCTAHLALMSTIVRMVEAGDCRLMRRQRRSLPS